MSAQLTPSVRIGYRRLFAVVAVMLGLVLLAGCDKPVPAISVVSQGNYYRSPALVWCFEGQKFSGAGSCAERGGARPRVKVRTGDQVSVEVPQIVRDRGWYVAVGLGRDDKGEEKYQRGPIQRDHSYFSFTVPAFPSSQVMTVQVIALDGGDHNSGIWQFFLVNKDADGG